MTIKQLKKGLVALIFLSLFGWILYYAAIWGYETYMETTLSLELIERKVNGPSSEFAYQEERVQGSLKGVQEQLNDLAERQQLMEKFLVLPIDAQGRHVLNIADVGYYLGFLSSARTSSGPTIWSEDPSPAHGTSTLWVRNAYELRIPYNPDWGNAAYTVAPYEFEGEDILFGPIHASEMTGVYRGARFSTTEPQTLNEVLTDPKNQEIPCGLTDDPIPPKVLKIGKHQVVQVVVDTCELGVVTYILPGKGNNYVFRTNQDTELLKWVIERFREK